MSGSEKDNFQDSPNIENEQNPEFSEILQRPKIVPVYRIIPNMDLRNLYPQNDYRSPRRYIDGESITIGNPHPTEFSEDTLLFVEQNIDKLRKLFKDQILIDLGAGKSKYGYEIASLLHTKAYVAVEPCNTDSLYEKFTRGDLQSRPEFEQKNIIREYKSIPISIDDDDMLTFLRRLPDNSVSIQCSGIDRCIIQNRIYAAKVIEEIERVLSDTGAYICYCSQAVETSNLKKIITGNSGNVYVFIK